MIQKSGLSETIEAVRPRVIAGFGRSGTTWVQDVLAESNSLRAVFEPLNPALIKGAEKHAHRFLRAGDEDPALYRFLHRFFFGNFHSLWADYRVVGRRLYPRPGDLISWQRLARVLRHQISAKDNLLRYWSQRGRSERIVKFVRANMMLGWIKEKFDARIVFIIRHPAAVVLSQMRAPRAWNPYGNIERYREDSRLLDFLGENSRRLLSRKHGDIEAFTLTWCIENAVALTQSAESDITVVNYETLVQQGESEWERILSALELGMVPDMGLVSRPSQQTWGIKAADAKLTRQYAAWMEHIDGATAVRIQKILDATSMNMYNVAEALPSKHT